MRALFIVAISATLLAAPNASRAQDRIAYANIEMILSLMPETKAAAASVDSLGRDLAKDLERKEAVAQKKVEEARSAQAKGASEAELDKFRKELNALEQQMRKDAEAADDKLAKRRSDLVQPLLDRLEKTIREVAKEEKYTFVLNAVDGDGNSIVLYGEESRDITEKVLKKLGIAPPKKAASKASSK